MNKQIYAVSARSVALLINVSLLLLGLGISSCTTKPKSGTINGSVILDNDTGDQANDPVDYSGVTVALYEPAALDTFLLRMNRDYPQIGVQLSQSTDFDHRSADPVQTTASNADGTFALKGIESGSYNLVFMKEGWGIRYLHTLSVTEGENVNLDPADLYPVREFHGTITEDITFASDHTYLIQGDTNFLGSVNVLPRTQIYVNPASRLKFYGGFITPDLNDPGEFWKLLSAAQMYSISQYDLLMDDYMGSLEIHGDHISLSGGMINHISSSIALLSPQSEISDTAIRHIGGGISMTQGQGTFRNMIIANGNSIGFQLLSDTSSPSTITKCIVSGMSTGVTLRIPGGYDVNNCYFSYNDIAIFPSSCTGIINHNAFDRNVVDINQVNTMVASNTSYNNFFGSTGVSIYPRKRATVNNNNFYKPYGSNSLFFHIRYPSSPYTTVLEDIDATNNYWAVSDVGTYIIDAADNGDYPGQPCPFYVIYQPRRSNPVANAGIQ